MAGLIIVIIDPLVEFRLPSISGFLSLSVGLDSVSGGSSPFLLHSCPVRSLNSATTSILGQLSMLESADVHCFSFVQAFSSLLLEVFNSLLINVFIEWKDIRRSLACTSVFPFLASVSVHSYATSEALQYVQSVGGSFCYLKQVLKPDKAASSISRKQNVRRKRAYRGCDYDQ
nr:hypothetical transcript [Hymenolepis microstoma]